MTEIIKLVTMVANEFRYIACNVKNYWISKAEIAHLPNI